LCLKAESLCEAGIINTDEISAVLAVLGAFPEKWAPIQRAFRVSNRDGL
jgi:hypothetical protein